MAKVGWAGGMECEAGCASNAIKGCTPQHARGYGEAYRRAKARCEAAVVAWLVAMRGPGETCGPTAALTVRPHYRHRSFTQVSCCKSGGLALSSGDLGARGEERGARLVPLPARGGLFASVTRESTPPHNVGYVIARLFEAERRGK